MASQNKEIFIPGPSGRIQAKYFKSKQHGAPIALVLQPHPQYGGTMNNRIVYETFNAYLNNGFSVVRINFRGVEKSDGMFDNGQGELSDAAAALDWIEKDNENYSQCWVSGFSFSIQSNAAAASESSPWPLSNTPSLLSTPLKFILITENLFL